MSARKSQYQRGFEEGFDTGQADGLSMGRREILDWLQSKYIDDPDRPDRGSPQGEALLQFAQEAMMQFQQKIKEEGQ